MKIKIYCDTRHCENFKIIDWNGTDNINWICDDCRFKFGDIKENDNL